MRAISLHQPHASLIAWGYKPFETRGWPTLYRGPLLIHAAKRPMDHEGMDLAMKFFGDDWAHLPTGVFVCQVELCRVFTTPLVEGFMEGLGDDYSNGLGDFSPGRFAWLLGEVQRFAEPIPARGHQRFWDERSWAVDCVNKIPQPWRAAP